MNKLLWVDLEMTGLYVDEERIIEIAAIVTDLNMYELAEYHAVIYQDAELLASMDDWNKEHHGASGLLDKVPHGKPESEVEKELIQFISKHFSLDQEQPVLCGNSIYQDRRFIDKYWPEFSKMLHYRMLDVSSWKLVFKEKYKKEFHKTNTHKALNDIRESIAELQYYMNYIQLEEEL